MCGGTLQSKQEAGARMGVKEAPQPTPTSQGERFAPPAHFAAHTLKPEGYREDEHVPRAKMTCRFMKRFILKEKFAPLQA